MVFIDSVSPDRKQTTLKPAPAAQWIDVGVWVTQTHFKMCLVNPDYLTLGLKQKFLDTQPSRLSGCRIFSRPGDYTSEMHDRAPLGDLRECWALTGDAHWGKSECEPRDLFHILWDLEVTKNPESTIADIMPYLYKHFGRGAPSDALVCMRRGEPVPQTAKWLDVKGRVEVVRLKRCHVALKEALPAPLGEQDKAEEPEVNEGEQDRAEGPEVKEGEQAMIEDAASDMDDCEQNEEGTGAASSTGAASRKRKDARVRVRPGRKRRELSV